MPLSERDRVSEAVWPWPDRADDERGRIRRAIRRRSLVRASALALVGGVLVLATGYALAGRIVLAAAAVVMTAGLLAPAWYAAAERAGAYVGRAAGVALTWILLSTLYLAVFVPGGVLLLLLRRDPLRRSFPSAEESYWVPHAPHAPDNDPAGFTRQY